MAHATSSVLNLNMVQSAIMLTTAPAHSRHTVPRRRFLSHFHHHPPLTVRRWLQSRRYRSRYVLPSPQEPFPPATLITINRPGQASKPSADAKTPGSLAAAFQSWAYGGFTPAGGAFATLTSMGMLGFLAPLETTAAAVLATGVTVVVWACGVGR